MQISAVSPYKIHIAENRGVFHDRNLPGSCNFLAALATPLRALLCPGIILEVRFSFRLRGRLCCCSAAVCGSTAWVDDAPSAPDDEG